MLTQQQLDELRIKLDSTLVDIKSELGELEDARGEVKPVDFGNDVESSDDAPEEADETEELGTNTAIASGLKERLENIANALRKMNKNEFGKCEKCSMDIPYEVLKVVPESRLCKMCKAE